MEKSLTHEVFAKFRDLIHQKYGIYYADVKKDLLSLKLNRCLAKSGINSYEDYFNVISSDGNCDFLSHFIDEITVNKTDFFREISHYEFIKKEFDYICSNNPVIVKNKEIRVWSMACSTGQEAYTLAMVLNETLPFAFSIRILATDISNRVLKLATAGRYPVDIKNEVDPFYLEKYFSQSQDAFQVNNDIKSLVTFRQFNLMNQFPFSGYFDIIFCRNVMIYFNLETQKELLAKIYNCLNKGGLLFIGQSESILNKNHNFKHIKSSIYIK